MAEKTLIARTRADVENPGSLLVTSPVVGRADNVPAVGHYLNPFDVLLTVEILNERFLLRLPRDVQGRVVATFLPRALTPVAFDTPLLRLDPRALESSQPGPGAPGGPATHEPEAASEGLIEVNSPTEGIFYRKASPETPPFVEEGSTIVSGTVLGLVEVMKCFNQITYGGPGLPARVEVTKILVQDAAEVEFGQPLFRVRPVE